MPKTAGHSITTALTEQVAGAVPHPVRDWGRLPIGGAARYASGRLGRDAIARRWSFCFVRDPWDWAVSGWLYVTRNRPHYGEDPPAFADFVRGGWRRGLCRNQHPRKFRSARASVVYHTQVTQGAHLSLGLPPRPAPIAFHARFEHLAKDWARICERLGQDVALPHVNRSERAPYTDYYDDETRRIVADRNAPLIARFAYRFGG